MPLFMLGRKDPCSIIISTFITYIKVHDQARVDQLIVFVKLPWVFVNEVDETRHMRFICTGKHATIEFGVLIGI